MDSMPNQIAIDTASGHIHLVRNGREYSGQLSRQWVKVIRALLANRRGVWVNCHTKIWLLAA